MCQNAFFSIFDELQELERFSGDITAAISQESIYTQIFQGSALEMENGEDIPPAFEAIASGNGVGDGRYPNLGYLLSTIAHEIYIYGNMGLVTDLRSPGEIHFRLIAPNFQDPEHPDRASYDEVHEGISVECVRRNSRQLEDGYGEPYLFPALLDYRKLKQVEAEVFQLPKQIEMGGRPEALQKRLNTLAKTRHRLRQQIIDVIGLEYQEDDIHHFSNATRTQLVNDVCQAVTENILRPVADAHGLDQMPEIIVP